VDEPLGGADAAGVAAGVGEPVDDVGGDASRAAEAFPVEAGFFAIFAWYPVRPGVSFGTPGMTVCAT
jgi:hypothetical protein